MFITQLAATTVVTGLTGCAGSSPDGGEETTAETQAATTGETRGETTTEAQTRTAIGTRMGTTGGETATAKLTGTGDSPPDIPRPGTPPLPTGTPANESAAAQSEIAENSHQPRLQKRRERDESVGKHERRDNGSRSKGKSGGKGESHQI